MLTLNDTMQAVTVRLDELRQRIIANMTNAGQMVSGRTAQSLQVEKPADNEVRLVARPFFSALETGSQPWSGRTGNHITAQEFRTVIRVWAERKGIVPADMTPESFAFVVARKIMRQGSRLYRNGGRNDIFTPEVEQAEKDIKQIVANSLTSEINTIIQAIINYKNTGQWQQ